MIEVAETTDFAALFEEVTGHSTVTDRQQIDVAVRLGERPREASLAERIDSTDAHDFDDVATETQPY